MADPILRRPLPTEYAAYYEGYVSAVPGTDILAALRQERDAALSLLESVPAEKVEYRYAPEKWTLIQVFGHVIDMEWVFAVRALHFARGVPGPMPGVDQDDTMKVANFEARPWKSLLEQFRHLRSANILLFESFDDAAWSRAGIASGFSVTPLALAYIIAGHQRHHLDVIRERYLR
jgi:hypothetical protein